MTFPLQFQILKLIFDIILGLFRVFRFPRARFFVLNFSLFSSLGFPVSPDTTKVLITSCLEKTRYVVYAKIDVRHVLDSISLVVGISHYGLGMWYPK